MSPPFADFSVGELIASIVGGVVTVGGLFGGGGAFLLNHLSKEKAAQRAHDLAMIEKIEEISNKAQEQAEKYDEATGRLGSAIADAIKAVSQEHRIEFRKMFDTLLEIQHGAMEVTAGVSLRLSELSGAVAELRMQMGKASVPKLEN